MRMKGATQALLLPLLVPAAHTFRVEGLQVSVSPIVDSIEVHVGRLSFVLHDDQSSKTETACLLHFDPANLPQSDNIGCQVPTYGFSFRKGDNATTSWPMANISSIEFDLFHTIQVYPLLPNNTISNHPLIAIRKEILRATLNPTNFTCDNASPVDTCGSPTYETALIPTFVGLYTAPAGWVGDPGNSSQPGIDTKYKPGPEALIDLYSNILVNSTTGRPVDGNVSLVQQGYREASPATS
ncbi:MAG: hypothetical protein M1824_004164 [Vezdaea acicularis]|nr:MAG: hypothetical protein M1824_004164 [Vezdaea acicularis]